jgi:Flp pilus assembly protein TadG
MCTGDDAGYNKGRSTLTEHNRMVAPQAAVYAERGSFAPLAKPFKKRILNAARAFLRRNEAGGSLVELALSLPILLLIMTGIFSFSIALNQKLEVTEAVSTGGRFLAIDRGDTDPCASTAAKVYAAAPTLGQSSMTFAFAITNGTTTTSYSKPTCSGAIMTTGGSAMLQVSYPCSLSVYGATFPCHISTQVTEVIQ